MKALGAMFATWSVAIASIWIHAKCAPVVWSLLVGGNGPTPSQWAGYAILAAMLTHQSSPNWNEETEIQRWVRQAVYGLVSAPLLTGIAWLYKAVIG